MNDWRKYFIREMIVLNLSNTDIYEEVKKETH